MSFQRAFSVPEYVLDLDEFSDYMVLCIILNFEMGHPIKTEEVQEWYREYLKGKEHE